MNKVAFYLCFDSERTKVGKVLGPRKSPQTCERMKLDDDGMDGPYTTECDRKSV